ncbi:MAG: CRTAC1 family protein [Bacteroidota bacterium]
MKLHGLFITVLLLNAFVIFAQQRPDSGSEKEAPIRFMNVASEMGLTDPILGVAVHGAAWGDINNDCYPDLFLGVFINHSTKPNLILVNRAGKKFEKTDNPDVESVRSRNSGASFSDLDGDGDDDLVVVHVNHVLGAGGSVELGRSNYLYRNDGKGNFTDVTPASNIGFTGEWTGRNPFVLDYNGDGMLDLLMQDDDVWENSRGYSRLMKNCGDLVFEDVTLSSGLGTHLNGLGGAVADINGDSWPDFFFAQTSDMYINQKDGTFSRVDYGFIAPPYKRSRDEGNVEWTCGADLGDLDNDGDLDLVMGDHFQELPHRIFVYLNDGNDAQGYPQFRNISDAAGVITASQRQPYVEIQDFDNDGRLDILVGNPEIFIYRNQGLKNGIPQLGLVSIPEDASAGFLKYWVSAPSADFNLDGKMDIYFGSYDSLVLSPMLLNTSPDKNFLKVRVNLPSGGNRKGIGATVRIYEKGMAENPEGLLGMQYITVSRGYSSGGIPEAHFGIPGKESVDVVVRMPCDGPVFRSVAGKNSSCILPRAPEIIPK